ncbi:MAG: hypothetical protein IT304_02890 [Dehalococcoidia bacterium]|nr:hypothetical protein [Dehalococcoidia bacterium]
MFERMLAEALQADWLATERERRQRGDWERLTRVEELEQEAAVARARAGLASGRLPRAA